MFDFPGKTLSPGKITSLEQEVIKAAQAGSNETAWRKLQPLRTAQRRQHEAVMSLLRIIDQRCLPMDRAIELLSEIAGSHHRDVEIMTALGECLEAVRDIDDLNAPPPLDTVFHTIVERLAAFAKDHDGLPGEEAILRGLATSARMLARQCDEIAQNSYRKLTEINPRNSAYHYN